MSRPDVPSMTQSRRLSDGGLIDRARPLLFKFNGQPFQGYVGDTLASALIANEVTIVARSPVLHRPRGIVSCGADEPNAVVDVRGTSSGPHTALATSLQLFDGLEAISRNHWPSLGFDVLAAKPYLPRRLASLLPAGDDAERPAVSVDSALAFCDVLIVGAGPAGLMAALAAARAKARVILVDHDSIPGGRLLSERITINQMPAKAWLKETLHELQSAPNVRLMMNATLRATLLSTPSRYTIIERLNGDLPGALAYRPQERHWTVTAKQAITALGGIERPLVFTNNDRPGIMLAGSVRAYINRYAVLPGERVILYATHDEAAATIFDVTAAGGIVEVVIDPRRAKSDFVAAAAERVGADVITGAIVRASGQRRVTSVEVKLAGGGTRNFDCDLVAMSDGWCPARSVASAAAPEITDVQVFALADSLKTGLAAGLNAALKAGFPDALVDLPEADEDTAIAAATHPRGRPLRGCAAPGLTGGTAFINAARDVAAQAVPAAIETADVILITAMTGEWPDDSQTPDRPRRQSAKTQGSVTAAELFRHQPKRNGRADGAAGVRAVSHVYTAVAHVVARPQQASALSARIASRIGVPLPPPGRFVCVEHLTLLSTAASEWLAIAALEDSQTFAEQMTEDLGMLAMIRDLGRSKRVVEMTGISVRDALAKGLDLDLASAVFQTGHCAEAKLNTIMVTISRCSDSSVDGSAVYKLVIDQSDIDLFATWLAGAAAEFGLETSQ
jgi:heterotetrameric sarcosine oxidase gamma subunit